MQLNDVIENVGRVIDAIGVAAIVIGSLAATIIAIKQLIARADDVYRGFRQRLGRAILLGLELLVAADIIRTVAATPTLNSVAVLAGIVLIRTFLSYSLEVEITGNWPWRRTPDATVTHTGRAQPDEPGPL